MAEIALSAGIRRNLISLSQTSQFLDATTERLSTGRKVNSALDNPSAYFAALNLQDRAGELEGRLDGMGQAISTLRAADAAIGAMRGIVSALKGKVDEALSTTSTSGRQSLGKQFNELMVQMHTLAKDASYKGINLADGNAALTVQFSNDYNASTLTIRGFDVAGPSSVNDDGVAVDEDGNATALTLNVVTGTSGASYTTQAYTIELATVSGSGSTSGLAIGWDGSDYRTALAQLADSIDSLDDALQNESKRMSTLVSVISVRQDFAVQQIDIMEGGADKLTLADLNEEGANLLTAQTAQQMGVQALSLASRAQQSLLRLIG